MILRGDLQEWQIKDAKSTHSQHTAKCGRERGNLIFFLAERLTRQNANQAQLFASVYCKLNMGTHTIGEEK